jgi:type I restriction enzyme S subunit
MATDLPADWAVLPLEECMAAIIDYRGKTPRKSLSGVPLVTAKVVKGGRILQEPREFIAEGDYDAWMRRGLPKTGDVVITTEAPMGEVAQLDGTKVALAQRLITLRGRPGLLDNTYLRYHLQSRYVQDQLRARSTGTTVLGFKQSELRKVALALPPISEQQAIAHVLGSLDDKVELNLRMNETLEGIARAIFKSWFVDFDPVRAKAEGRQPAGMDAATAALFPDEFEDTELGEVPKGWEVSAFSALCEPMENGGTPPRQTAEFWGGDIPWFKTGELRDGPLLASDEHINEAGLKSSACKRWPRGTVLCALYASPTVGRLGILEVDAAANQACVALRAKSPYSELFIFQTLLHSRERLQRIAVGAAQQNISQGVVREHRVLRPPGELVVAFTERVRCLYQAQVGNLRETRTLAAIRDTLLPKLLSGELRIDDPEAFLARATVHVGADIQSA